MDFNSLCVLIVDDEVFAQTIVSKVLQSLGVDANNIVTADTGLAAVEILKTLTTPVDLIISDVSSEEHTSELQSHHDLVCLLLLENKHQNFYL